MNIPTFEKEDLAGTNLFNDLSKSLLNKDA